MEDLEDLFELISEGEQMNEEPCKGLHFRGRKASFFDPTKMRVVRKQEFYLLKSKSCKGCYKCTRILNLLEEWGAEDIEFPYLIDSNATYRLEIKLSSDWETGYEDIDSSAFVKEE